MLEKVLYKSITEKYGQSTGVADNRVDVFVYNCEIRCKSQSFLIGFLYWKDRRIAGSRACNYKPLFKVTFLTGSIPASISGLKGYR